MDGSGAVFEWSAEPGSDFGDEAVWEAASPFWTERRLVLMRDQQSRDGFAEQWLNRWPKAPAERQASAWVPLELWMSGVRDRLPSAMSPVFGAVDEVLDGTAFSAAVGWLSADGAVCVEVTHRLRAQNDALRWCDARGAGRVIVGIGLRKTVAAEREPVGYGIRELRLATSHVKRAILEERLLHAPDEMLDDQVRNAVLMYRDGESISPSHSPVDVTGLKLVAWLTYHLHRDDAVDSEPAIFA